MGDRTRVTLALEILDCLCNPVVFIVFGWASFFVSGFLIVVGV
jgi:hypothetical protein